MEREGKPRFTYELPAAALEAVDAADLRCELVTICFSHYNLKARMALKAAGLPFTEHGHVPVGHVTVMLPLLKKFPKAAKSKRARGASPAATPTLAVYSAAGEPLFLLQDSSLISRWAALRAAALGTPDAPPLYGPDYRLATAGGQLEGEEGAAYRDIDEIEYRLSGAVGVEARRLVYAYYLPSASIMLPLLWHNAGSLRERLLLPLIWLALWSRAFKAFNITPATCQAARETLRAEFDWVGAMLKERGVGSRQRYLCGDQLSAADVALAGLASPVVGITQAEGYGAWLPATNPPELASLITELRAHPTGQYVLRLFQEQQAAAAAGGGPWGA